MINRILFASNKSKENTVQRKFTSRQWVKVLEHYKHWKKSVIGCENQQDKLYNVSQEKNSIE